MSGHAGPNECDKPKTRESKSPRAQRVPDDTDRQHDHRHRDRQLRGERESGRDSRKGGRHDLAVACDEERDTRKKQREASDIGRGLPGLGAGQRRKPDDDHQSEQREGCGAARTADAPSRECREDAPTDVEERRQHVSPERHGRDAVQ